jgi:hypothetical protein
MTAAGIPKLAEATAGILGAATGLRIECASRACAVLASVKITPWTCGERPTWAAPLALVATLDPAE